MSIGVETGTSGPANPPRVLANLKGCASVASVAALLLSQSSAFAQTEATDAAAPPTATAPAPAAPPAEAPAMTGEATAAPEPAPAVEPAAAPPEPEAAPAAEAQATATTEGMVAVAAEPAPMEEEAPPPEEPPGPAFVPLSYTGSFWSRYEMRNGYKDHGLTHPRLAREGDYIVSRARLGITTNPVDVGDGTKVSATFVPQAAYTFAENLGGPATIGDQAPVKIYEAFARVGTDKYKFDMGRFAMNYGDALTIGNLGWNENARAFYGARMHMTPGDKPYFIDAFATIINEGRLSSSKPFSGDTDFYGIYAGFGPLINETMALDAFLLGQTVFGTKGLTDPNDATVVLGDQATASEFTLGTRVKDAVSSFDYRLEAALQFGTRPVAPTATDSSPSAQDVFAYQADAEVGVTPAKGFRFGLGGLVASGDDPNTSKNEAYDQLYPTAHKFLGLADIAGGRSNMLSGNAHLSYVASKALILKADGHLFNTMQKNAADKTYMGSEVDVNVVHPIGGGAVLRAMYALFLPNKDFWEAQSQAGTAGDAMHYLEIQFGYDFK